MDNTKVRTAAELEQKYNLSRLANYAVNIETNSKDIIKIQKQLEDTLKTIVINLGDTLQSSVSLWFYEGTPTTSNEPYTDWNDPTEHYDDLYYDQLTGYVYKFTSNGWDRQYDLSLIGAMALTNAELDVSLDHERQVYLTQPTPPYSSGDWWIQEDGTLYICQLGKTSGDYEEDDFLISTKYTSNIATKENDTITVLKGTVQVITEDYVQYTDLSTGGSSVINGDNITTGTIKSSNYIQGTSGTKLSLNNGAIDSKYFKLDQYGRVECNQISINGGTELNRNFEIKDNDTNRYGYILPGLIGFTRDISNTKQIYATFGNDYEDNLPMNEIELGLITYTPDHSSSTMTQGIRITSYEDYGSIAVNNAGNNVIYLDGDTGNITCVSLTQTSLEKDKKNIEKYEGALNEILKTDIYKYNLNIEKDDTKKHLGFVIGKDRKYSKEIVATKDGKETGVELYSMTSLCLQAIKEQQNEIEELKKELDELKKEVKNV